MTTGFVQVATVGTNVTTYSDTGLSASTTYYYQVRAYNGAGDSAYSNTANASTSAPPATAPTAPTSLAATAASSSSINLTWVDSSSDETSFKIERSTSATTGFAQIATVGANVTTYSDAGLSASATYYYRLRATNSAGDSAYSNAANASTSAPPVTVPTAPASLAATAASSSGINLSWTDASADETGFGIERSNSATTGFVQIATVGASVATYSDTGLSASATYYYRVRAYNSAGNSTYSNTANASTSAPPATTPTAPTGLAATAASSAGINLSWTDTSTSETGFKIERSTSATTGFVQIAAVGANITMYSDAGLTGSTNYYYRVRATNSAGDSAYSNTANASTSAPPVTVPTAPASLAATAASSSGINLSWTDASADETGFGIERSNSATTGFVQIATVGANVATYSDTGLSASATYYYRVRATNSAGNSAYSNTANATTSAPPVTTPTAPTGLAATAASSAGINLSWTDASANETGFKIERSTSATTGFVQITAVGANITTYSDTGLGASTTYYYRVRATNSAGDSAYSSTANASTTAATPNAPTNMVVSSITANSAVLSWTDNSSNETGFQIGSCSGQVSTDSNGVMSCVSGFTAIASVGANSTSYTLTGLAASTAYSRFVLAYNSGGSSASTGKSFTTAVGTQTVTLTATASNLVKSASFDSTLANTAYPNTYPSVGILWGWNAGGSLPHLAAYAGLVKFNTSALAGKTIDSATLNLTTNSAPTGSSPQNFNIGAIATAWSPTTVTWNTSANFQYYTASWQTLAYPTYNLQAYSIDLRSTVQNWANATWANNGIGFLSTNYGYNPGNVTSFDFYEFMTPTLTVTYH